ncbi:MAG: glycosyltransferase family 39 protein [Anaerolineae bacterium]|nr:glycosyltransferase family 39 protein [Anaerolineae bacterium]
MVTTLFAQMLSAATQLSAIVDEGFHITSGYEYLRTGNLQLFDEHAPLAKALLAWPLFFVPDLPPPEAASGYAAGDLIAVAQQTTLAYRPLDRVIVAPRVAAALLSLLLAATIYRGAAALAGPAAGLLAIALCAFDPNFIAHGSLATTDMGSTAFTFWAIWSGTLWLERPTRRRWWVTALLLGLAQGAKLTALLIYPVLGIGVLVAAGCDAGTDPTVVRKGTQHTDRRGVDWRLLARRTLSYVGMVAMSFMVLWALYGFELRPVVGIFGGEVPLPAAGHIERWLRLEENLAYGRESFLLGQNGMQGWPLYFPIAFLVKTPLPLLLLCTWAAGTWLRETVRTRTRAARSRLSAGKRLSLFLFPAVYGLASLTSHLNIGYRHLLPVLPFLYVGVASCLGPALAPRPARVPLGPLSTSSIRRKISRLAVGVLVTWTGLSTLRVTPHYLAYFNELAGGIENGWRFLADSNTDWGQTFKALAQHQEESALGPVKLSAFTFYDPGAYGVDYEPISPMPGAPTVLPRRFNPAPGVYAISATTLDGVPLAYPAMFDWFRHREPFSRIGHVMFLYDVHPLPGTWVAQCSAPAVPLTADAVDEGLGISGLRHVMFDCERSWVLAGGGATPGWYARAIPEQTRLQWPDAGEQRSELLPEWMAAMPLDGLVLSYVQPRNGTLPAFAMWECNACGLPEPARTVELDGVIAFLGITAPSVAKAGTTVEVMTVWEIVTPPDRLISLKLHLSGNDGIPIVLGDGLGYPVEQWEPGDQLVQHHSLAIDDTVPPGEYTLSTGAYWLDNLAPLGAEALTFQLRVE